MSNPNKMDTLSISLDGFEGPIDLLLSLAREHKIDLTKLSILPLAEQYLVFLDNVIKKDIDIAAEYLVMGAWLAFLKSKILLPQEKNENPDNEEEISKMIEYQMKRLEAIQKVSIKLFKRYQLGTHFFKRGNPESFYDRQKIQYKISLYELMKSYGKIPSINNSKSITIAETKLYSVEEAIKRLRNFLSNSSGWMNILDFIPNNIRGELEKRSAIASHFVASLELVKEGDVLLRQDDFNNKIMLNLKNSL